MLNCKCGGKRNVKEQKIYQKLLCRGYSYGFSKRLLEYVEYRILSLGKAGRKGHMECYMQYFGYEDEHLKAEQNINDVICHKPVMF